VVWAFSSSDYERVDGSRVMWSLQEVVKGMDRVESTYIV
jgi:hypothetical protein